MVLTKVTGRIIFHGEKVRKEICRIGNCNKLKATANSSAFIWLRGESMPFPLNHGGLCGWTQNMVHVTSASFVGHALRAVSLGNFHFVSWTTCLEPEALCKKYDDSRLPCCKKVQGVGREQEKWNIKKMERETETERTKVPDMYIRH